jgi:hypothetical protein
VTRAVVIGQSHSAAIAQGLMTERPEVQGISVHRLEDSKRPYERDTITLSEAVRLVQELPPDALVFLSMLGTYHNILGLLRSGETFDFFLDPGEAPDPKAEVRIPHRAIESAFKQHLVTPAPIRKLRSATKTRIFLLSSPPPKKSNAFMLERFMSQKKKSYQGRSVAEVGLERPESRLKLWLLETRAMAEWASSEGLEFVPAPRQAIDPDGFLDPRFYLNDATHANAQYGALVIDQITEILKGSKKVAVHG